MDSLKRKQSSNFLCFVAENKYYLQPYNLLDLSLNKSFYVPFFNIFLTMHVAINDILDNEIHILREEDSPT